MSAQLNDVLLKVLWGELKQDLQGACLKFGISREIGECIRGLEFTTIGTLAANHPQLPLFELKHKDSPSFWRAAVDAANKTDDSEWSRITQHHALLMTTYPHAPEADAGRRAIGSQPRAHA